LPRPSRQAGSRARARTRGTGDLRRSEFPSDGRPRRQGAADADDAFRRGAGALRGRDAARGGHGDGHDRPRASRRTPGPCRAAVAAAPRAQAAPRRRPGARAACGAALEHGRGVHAGRASRAREALAYRDGRPRRRGLGLRRPRRAAGRGEIGSRPYGVLAMIPASSAGSRGLRSCGSCGMLSSAAQEHVECARCGAPLHDRRPDSLARTWALLTAAVILYVPANVLPVMYTDWLFGSQRDTIMSGVAYLWRSGSWPLALVVFVASVTVPLLKIVALAYLALSVQLRSSWQPHQRAGLDRIAVDVG